MSLKFPKMPDFSALSTEYTLPAIDNTKVGLPPREYPLDENEAKEVILIMDKFDEANLKTDNLFQIFHEWQSSKTKSIKRFVLSLSFLLSLTLFAGVNIADINLFGMSVQDGRSELFLFAILFILITTSGYYEYLRRFDLKVYKAKVRSAKSSLETGIELTEYLDRIVEKYKQIQSVKGLFDDFKGSFDHSMSDVETYTSLKFYKQNLRDVDKSRNWIEVLELVGLYCLIGIALIALIFSF